ncbi:MAG: hypothetical protein COS35_03290 [Zetaproteobacteria bacterium CG02_land_8_20_14_3_00_50_9]|nr:MAG: hypothetical protein COS35_03290 [Zetaproteobacteria bacterium CG02_land_8_20_14_3_00_50_9]PIY57133.1 MAG: hypothetical protein COZ00_00445 [Zetaproteobacteria bacterium CG_4_10_14_0_8_um_filter_49_80]
MNSNQCVRHSAFKRFSTGSVAAHSSAFSPSGLMIVLLAPAASRVSTTASLPVEAANISVV